MFRRKAERNHYESERSMKKVTRVYTPIEGYRTLSADNLIGLLLIPLTILAVWFYMVLKLDAPTDRETFELSVGRGLFWYLLVGVPLFWKFPRGNKARIVKNIFGSEPRAVTDAQMTQTIQPPRTQKGVYGGPSFVPFWWRPVGKPIELVTGKQINRKIEVNDMFNQTYVLDFIMNHKPAVGRYLPNYLQFTDEEAIEVAMAEIEIIANKKFTNLVGDDVRRNIDEANRWMKDVLGGDDKMSTSERMTGRNFFGLKIKSVKQGEQAQRAAEEIVEAEKTAAAVEILTKKGVNPDLAAIIQSDKEGLLYVGGNAGLASLLPGLHGGNRGGQRGGGGGNRRNNRRNHGGHQP